MRHFILVVSFLSAAFTRAGWALPPDVQELQLNGYQVFLINTHAGNGVALTANVQGGSWHDDPVTQAGRAHLFEHWVHCGSERFPGHQTFHDLMARIGGDYNAYTADSRTFYHWFGHPDGLPAAAQAVGAMLSRPEFNLEAYGRELAVVMNEAQEYQNQDTRALGTLIWLELLPDGHPLKMYDVGTQAQLRAMKPQDLKDWFHANYVRGSMQIIAAGNFDAVDGKPSMTAETLIQAISENFHPPVVASPEPPAKTKAFPPLVSPAQGRWVEVGTAQDHRLLSLIFEIEGEIHPGVLETLLDHFNLPLQGSLRDQLQKRGWINALHVSPTRVNHLQLVDVQFNLTPLGAEHREEVVRTFLAAVGDLAIHGLAPDEIGYLHERNLRSYGQKLREADAAAEYLAKFLSEDLNPRQAFDLQAIYGRVTAKAVREAARSVFPLARMLGGYLGPDVKATRENAEFHRPVQVMSLSASWEAAYRGGREAPVHSLLRLPKMDLPFASTPLQGNDRPARFIVHQPGLTIALHESHRVNEAGILAHLTLPARPALDQQALRLWTMAFLENIKSEWDYLASLNLELKIDSGASALTFSVTGNSGAAPAVLNWAVEKFHAFRATAAGLDAQRARLRAAYRQDEDEFTAKIALRGAVSFLRGPRVFHPQELGDALEALDLESVPARVASQLERADIELVIAGDADETGARSLAGKLQAFFPHARTESDRAVSRTFPLPTEDLVFWQRLAATKSDDQYGWARVFPGPKAGTRQHAAFVILRHVLGKKIFEINRTEQKLGYVHNATSSVTHSGIRPIFYGQTQGEENLRKMEAGWRRALDLVAQGTLADDGFAGARQAILREEDLLPYDFGTVAAELHYAIESTGRADGHAQWLEDLRTVTAEEIYAVGREYLLGQPVLDTIAARNTPPGCAAALTSTDDVRARLRRPPER